MSLTSYRTAPPRDTGKPGKRMTCEWVPVFASTIKPGGDLLFHRLGDSTIGAVWFHGRVRDGIGWGTDAMTTKLNRRR